MSSKPVITANKLSKRYRLGLINRRTFRDELKYNLLRLRGKDPSRELLKVGREAGAAGDFWALKDVSFEIEQGEVVGVIGGNGAGKSTLLKLLTRITEPTSGSATIRGRVGSLLEVGTGFHPELTGRENIYMNGTILGMKKREIDAKLDEIVDFSGVEKFIDTPVKRYSSGMYVRLAFAVAAHLEPEVLLVDEVLAVGDADFQKKCLGKMGEISREGRTILFVSHNMAAVENLCSRAVWLEGGLVRQIGDSSGIIRNYLSSSSFSAISSSLGEREDRLGSGAARIVDFSVATTGGEPVSILQSGQNYRFRLVCNLAMEVKKIKDVVVSIALSNHYDQTVWLVRSNFTNQNQELEGNSVVECVVRDFNLGEGTYSATVYLGHGESEILDLVVNAGQIVVEGGDFFGTGSRGLPSHCATLTHAEWSSFLCV